MNQTSCFYLLISINELILWKNKERYVDTQVVMHLKQSIYRRMPISLKKWQYSQSLPVRDLRKICTKPYEESQTLNTSRRQVLCSMWLPLKSQEIRCMLPKFENQKNSWMIWLVLDWCLWCKSTKCQLWKPRHIRCITLMPFQESISTGSHNPIDLLASYQ